jgi:hypothetical protein
MINNKLKFLFSTIIVLYLVSGQVYPNIHFHIHQHNGETEIEICLKPIDQKHGHDDCCEIEDWAHFIRYKEAENIKKPTRYDQEYPVAIELIEKENLQFFTIHSPKLLIKSSNLTYGLNNKAPPPLNIVTKF